ncbi:class I SAM-dependent methyltransferase [uncultured Helicobacter sp.]|uniref:class I SAM-dependent methyltransferase n=1 Tax=uncultured Helicobacter sp. TaxID=175537 RepID=UPI00374E2E31
MIDIDLDKIELEPKDRAALQALLDSQDPNISDDVEQMWYLVNQVWEEMGCDNKKLDWDKIGAYYAHPVWILNGLFTQYDKLSFSIRESIARYIASKNFEKICDYGGGFGTLAGEIAKVCPNAQIEIYEPFPSVYGKKYIQNFANIRFVDVLEPEKYDCLVSTDVLEHVNDPMTTFGEMLDSLKPGGEALIGNCFYPVIECHLPKNFHFRYTFNFLARFFGLKKLGNIKGAEYVQIFIKSRKASEILIGGGVALSKAIYPFILALEPLRPLARICKRAILKHKCQ